MQQQETQQHLGALDLPTGAPKGTVLPRALFEVVWQKLLQYLPGLVGSVQVLHAPEGRADTWKSQLLG